MPYKILLVDDDRDPLKMLSGYLRLKGYAVETAAPAQAAVPARGRAAD